MDDSPSCTAARRRSPLRKLGCAVLATLVVLLAAVETLARVADGVLTRRAAEPGYKPSAEPQGLIPGFYLLTIRPLGPNENDLIALAPLAIGRALALLSHG